MRQIRQLSIQKLYFFFNRSLQSALFFAVMLLIFSSVQGQINSPTGVAVDASGNVYVADWLNHKIRKITSAGVVSTLAGGR